MKDYFNILKTSLEGYPSNEKAVENVDTAFAAIKDSSNEDYLIGKGGVIDCAFANCLQSTMGSTPAVVAKELVEKGYEIDPSQCSSIDKLATALSVLYKKEAEAYYNDVIEHAAERRQAAKEAVEVLSELSQIIKSAPAEDFAEVSQKIEAAIARVFSQLADQKVRPKEFKKAYETKSPFGFLPGVTYGKSIEEQGKSVVEKAQSTIAIRTAQLDNHAEMAHKAVTALYGQLVTKPVDELERIDITNMLQEAFKPEIAAADFKRHYSQRSEFGRLSNSANSKDSIADFIAGKADAIRVQRVEKAKHAEFLESKVAEQDKRISQLDEALEDRRSELASSKDTIAEQRETLFKAGKLGSELVSEKQRMESTVEVLGKNLDGRNALMEEFSETHEETVRDVEAAREELLKAAAREAELSRDLEKMEQVTGRLEDEYGDIKKQLESEVTRNKESQAELRSELEDKQAQVNELKESATILGEDLSNAAEDKKAAESRLEELESTVQSQIVEIGSLTDQLEREKASVRIIKAAHKAAQKSVNALEIERDDVVEALEREGLRHQAEEAELNSTIESQQVELKQEASKYGSLQKLYKVEESKNEKLVDAIAESERAKKVIEGDLDASRDALQSETARHSKAEKELKAELGAKSEALSNEEARTLELGSQLSEANEAKNKLEVQVAELTNSVEEREAVNSELRRELDEARNETAQIDIEKKAVEQRVVQLSSELDDSQQALREASVAHQEVERELRDELEGKDGEIDELRNEVGSLEGRIDEAARELASEKERNQQAEKALRDEISKGESALSEAKGQQEAQQSAIAELNESLLENTEEKDELSRQLELLKGTNEDLDQDLKALQTDVVRLTGQLKDVTDKARETQRLLELSNGENEELARGLQIQQERADALQLALEGQVNLLQAKEVLIAKQGEIIAGLREKIESLTERNGILDGELEEQQSLNKTQEDLIADLRETIVQHEVTIEKQVVSLSEKDEQLVAATRESDALKVSLEDSEETVQRQGEELVQLREDNVGLTSGTKILSEENDTLKDKNAEQAHEIESLRATVLGLQASNAKLLADNKDLRERHTEVVNEKDREISKLRDALKEKTKPADTRGTQTVDDYRDLSMMASREASVGMTSAGTQTDPSKRSKDKKENKGGAILDFDDIPDLVLSSDARKKGKSGSSTVDPGEFHNLFPFKANCKDYKAKGEAPSFFRLLKAIVFEIEAPTTQAVLADKEVVEHTTSSGLYMTSEQDGDVYRVKLNAKAIPGESQKDFDTRVAQAGIDMVKQVLANGHTEMTLKGDKRAVEAAYNFLKAKGLLDEIEIKFEKTDFKPADAPSEITKQVVSGHVNPDIKLPAEMYQGKTSSTGGKSADNHFQLLDVYQLLRTQSLESQKLSEKPMPLSSCGTESRMDEESEAFDTLQSTF